MTLTSYAMILLNTSPKFLKMKSKRRIRFFSLFCFICRINRKVMMAINAAIESAEHSSTKRQLLAIVAADFSSAILRSYFPNITDYQIKAARKHAYRFGEKQL